MGAPSLCLICDEDCSYATGGTGNKKDNNSISMCNEILVNLHMYFVVQKLLQIPDTSCENLISTYGGTLSEWSNSFCTHCTHVIEEAKQVSHQISSLVSKFEGLQQKLQEKVSNLSEVSKSSSSSLSGFPAELRKLCVERVNFVRGNRRLDERHESEPSEGDQDELSMDSEASDGQSQRTQESPSQVQEGSSPSPVIPSDLSFSAMKSSPASLRYEKLIDEISDDPGFLDPGSVLQVVSEYSDIGSSKSDALYSAERRKIVTLNEVCSAQSPSGKGLGRFSSTKKSEFFKKIMELHSSQAKNTVLITKDKYRKIVIDLKVLRDTGRRTKFISNYYKRYELLEYRDTLTLVRSGTQKRVVAAEDLFDVINSAHLSTNHGGRDSILKFLKDEFFNVTKHQVNTFLSICEGCATKRTRKR